jgi:hypothetical protein
VEVHFGGRLFGHGVPRPQQHLAGDAGRHALPHRVRGTWRAKAKRPPHRFGDMPFGTYATPEQAFRSASEVDACGCAHGQARRRCLVGPDGGVSGDAWHTGVWPYRTHTSKRQYLGRLPVQGRSDSAAQQLMQDALQLEKAGAQMLVMEMVPAVLSGEITRALSTCATHRHRCGCGHRRTNFGVTRYVGRHPRQGAQVRP